MRFSFLLLRLMCAVVLLGGIPLVGTVHAESVLRVLAWPGYADADVIAAFEKSTGARVEVSFVDTDEELWSRLSNNNGEDFDVFAVNTAELQRYLRHGLSSPINLT